MIVIDEFRAIKIERTLRFERGGSSNSSTITDLFSTSRNELSSEFNKQRNSLRVTVFSQEADHGHQFQCSLSAWSVKVDSRGDK